MKNLFLLGIVLAATSCKKDGHSFEYRAECDFCNVEYVNSDEGYSSKVLHGTMRVDSIFQADTLALIDTVYMPEAWSYAFEGEHDQTARIRMEHFPEARTPSTVRLFIDGVEDQHRTISASEVTIHN